VNSENLFLNKNGKLCLKFLSATSEFQMLGQTVISLFLYYNSGVIKTLNKALELNLLIKLR
jgi:hypothetical protein